MDDIINNNDYDNNKRNLEKNFFFQKRTFFIYFFCVYSKWLLKWLFDLEIRCHFKQASWYKNFPFSLKKMCWESNCLPIFVTFCDDTWIWWEDFLTFIFLFLSGKIVKFDFWMLEDTWSENSRMIRFLLPAFFGQGLRGFNDSIEPQTRNKMTTEKSSKRTLSNKWGSGLQNEKLF